MIPGLTTTDHQGVKMALQQLALPGQVVKKHNELVRSKISITNVDGSRILANLIACIRHDDVDFQDTYRIAPKDFMADQGGKSYSTIKNVCRELAKATAEIEEPDPDGPHPILSIYTFFSSITYRKGIISARFNAEMKPLLLDLRRCFTQYNLMEYLTLSSIYSQRIFEFLKSWDDKPETPPIPLADLHEMLNTPDSLQRYPDFRRYVIEKAHKDITEKTTLSYEWEPVKQGRAVVAVRFIFAKKRALPVQKKKADNAIEKSSEEKNILYNQALACFKKRGAACEGGQQKKGVCEVCLKFFRV